jgi:hypothetical protein
MHSRARLKIPSFDWLRMVSEVEPPEAGVRSTKLNTSISRKTKQFRIKTVF